MNNYPVRYALMPIYDNNEVITYIVSKCYLLSEKKTYHEDGKCEEQFEIVYPYIRDKDNDRWIRNDVKSNYIFRTGRVYKTRQDAEKDAKSLNNYLIERKVSVIVQDRDKQQFRDIYNKKHEKYRCLSDLIEENTDVYLI